MDETSSPSSQLDATAKRSGGELKWPRQPYPGLRPFEVDDDIDESLVFFGRDKQKDEILRRLNDSHVVFVVGPSGSGKSSLVKAGVIPALRAGLLTSAGHHWRIAKTRPERRPLAQLAEALAELLTGTDDKVPISERRRAIEDLLRQEDSALWLIANSISERYAAEGHGRMRTLLLIDQFEEAFGPEIEDRAEVDQFFRILHSIFCKATQGSVPDRRDANGLHRLDCGAPGHRGDAERYGLSHADADAVSNGGSHQSARGDIWWCG